MRSRIVWVELRNASLLHPLSPASPGLAPNGTSPMMSSRPMRNDTLQVECPGVG